LVRLTLFTTTPACQGKKRRGGRRETSTSETKELRKKTQQEEEKIGDVFGSRWRSRQSTPTRIENAVWWARKERKKVEGL